MRRVTSVVLALAGAIAAVLVGSCSDNPVEPAGSAAPAAHMPISFATASTGSGATFTTDKDEYSPGDTLRLAGTGWQAGDFLDIHLDESPQNHPPVDWAIGVEENGTFQDSSYVVQESDLGVTFALTATSRASGESATATFTDGNIRAASAPGGVQFVLSRRSYTGVACTGTETILADITIGNSTTTVATAGGTNQPVSVKLIAAATSTLGASFSAWSSASSFTIVGGDSKVICVAGGSGNFDYLATYTAAPDLTITKALSGTFSVANPGGTYTISVSNAGTATALGNAGLTVKDTLPTGLTFVSGGGGATGWQGCNASGQVVSCDLANGQTILPGATKPFDLVVNVASGACPSVTNRAWVSGGGEPVANNGNNGSGDVATPISVGCPSANAPPSVDAGGPYTVAEGTERTLSPTVTDTDVGDVLTYKWTIVYTTPIDAGGSCSFNGTETDKNAKITCDDDSNGGTFTLTLEVKDGAGGHTVSDDADLTVTNANPSANAGTSYSGNEGDEIQLTGSGDDPGNNDDAHLTYQWSVNTNGIDAGGSCSFNGTDTDKNAKITCDDDSNGGTFDVSLVVEDDDNGTSATSHATLSVANVNPTADAGTSYSGNEGSAIQLGGSGDDAGSNDVPHLTYKWTVNTTGIDPSGSCSFNGTETDKNAKVTCTDDSNGGTFTLSLVVKDDDGGTSSTSTATLAVANVKPTISSLTKPDDTGLPSSVIVGATVDIKVTFTDPGSNDTHTAQIDCGSGTYADVNSGNDVTSPFQTSCTFNTVGSKTVRVKVADDDGLDDTKTYTVGVQYAFFGLFAPVDKPNVYNVSRAGQAIPLKWRLQDFYGNPVTTLTSVKVLVKDQTCDLGTSTDQVEEYATGQSGLQNFLDGNYQFNWATPKSYAKSCKTIGLDLGEGFTRTNLAWFTFKP
jgi:uncharacterized repeat protein (TIGR01451 family)